MADSSMLDKSINTIQDDEYEKILTVGRDFVDVVDRFMSLYDNILNFEFSPKI
jgi:hypothetical protein